MENNEKNSTNTPEKGYKLQPRKITEKLSNTAENMRKRRLQFYLHIYRYHNTDILKIFTQGKNTVAPSSQTQTRHEEHINRRYR